MWRLFLGAEVRRPAGRGAALFRINDLRDPAVHIERHWAADGPPFFMISLEKSCFSSSSVATWAAQSTIRGLLCAREWTRRG